MPTVAIIDLGTNTCNLLIATYDEDKYQILYQGKEVVKLGKGGIDKKQITPEAIERAVMALQQHSKKINEYNVSEIHVVATSAVRDASNRNDFVKQIKERCGFELNVIDGEKEAELIFKGVLLAFENPGENSLIMDIGGGSNEFILSDKSQIHCKHSFPQGMARIIERFSISEPITSHEIDTITSYFESGMESLWKSTAEKKIETLIGCSGAFDTIADLIDKTDPGSKQRIKQQITTEDFETIYKKLIHSTTSERLQMKGMEPIRVEMIVPAILLISVVIRKLNIQTIYQTDFALREGVLYQIMS